MANDDETPDQAPEPNELDPSASPPAVEASVEAHANQHPESAETHTTGVDVGAEDESDAHSTRRAGGVTGWLRGALSRLPSASRPLTADPLDALLVASIASEPISRATRAGEVIAALAPGAPVGVVAPEGAPRVARLIGRDDALIRALDALRSGSSLCVHGEGVAGVGKTTFAVEVASRAAERRSFVGGAAWISCEALSGDEGLAEVITRVARGLREQRALVALDSESRRAELVAGLRAADRPQTLLALDNIEPTLDIAALLDVLMGGYVTLLLTSRRAIDDPRLTPFPLTPLSAPFAGSLFSERLRLRDPRRPQPEEASLIEALAHSLGGAPLLLDLTAAMVGVYGGPLDVALVEAQTDGAKGMAGALRGRLDRHWQALSPEQQRTLVGLTLIEGATFPRAAALAIARTAAADMGPLEAEQQASAATEATEATEASRWRAAQSLDALIGLGLVEAMAAGRLRLHPLTRQRLGPRLAELDDVSQNMLGLAMSGWWLAYARDHSGYEGMAGLEAEAAGLMGALTWAHTQGHARLTLDLAESLGGAWRAHGRSDEALRIATWAAEAADMQGQPRERLWARYQLAVAQTESGRLIPARAGFAEALRLARELDDHLAIRDGAHALASLAARAGDSEQAREGFTEALALAREMEDAAAIRDELHGLAILNAQAGRLDDARAEYREALALARAGGDPTAIYLELHGLALVEMRLGALEQAQRACVEALALARELDDPGAQIDVLSSMGALDAQRGDTDYARDELEQALALAERIRDARRAARALVWLAEVEAANGDATSASERFQQARALYERLGDDEAGRVTERLRALGDAS
ncbi:MAG TPA: hypothetical protein VE338_10240 [Ktedonobacterales bacterium]|nr:hypothetical protein [Ktedonobacterales bacterium]